MQRSLDILHLCHKMVIQKQLPLPNGNLNAVASNNGRIRPPAKHQSKPESYQKSPKKSRSPTPARELSSSKFCFANREKANNIQRTPSPIPHDHHSSNFQENRSASSSKGYASADPGERRS
jgi:hypothetical protein